MPPRYSQKILRLLRTTYFCTVPLYQRHAWELRALAFDAVLLHTPQKLSIAALSFSHAKTDEMHGFTENYIRVELPMKQADSELDNQIVEVRLGDFNRDKTALMAEIIKR